MSSIVEDTSAADPFTTNQTTEGAGGIGQGQAKISVLEGFKQLNDAEKQWILQSTRGVVYSSKTKTSSMAICYIKAVETQLSQAREMQIKVWAKIAAHEDLSVRFEKFNKCLSLPAALLSSVTASLGLFTSAEARDLRRGIDNIGGCQTIAGCHGVVETKAAAEDIKPFMGYAIVILGAFITMLVTVNTHYGFGGLAAAHKEAYLSLMRFEQRIEKFIQRLKLSGTHLGSSVEAIQHTDGTEELGERKKRLDKLYRNWIVDLVDSFAELSKEQSTMEETAPNLKGPFTGFTSQMNGGSLLQHYEKCCRERQARKTTLEDSVAMNVENASLDIDDDIESGDPFGAVVNRSIFDHVPYRDHDDYVNEEGAKK